MKVSVLSDLHIDNHIDQTDPIRIKDRVIIEAFKDVLESSESVEVLIVAGDLGHYNAQAQQVLSRIAELFNYKRIFCTLGNHDLYRSANHSTTNRICDWYAYDDPNNVVHILNGNVVEYRGVRFGGAMGWYDGNYSKYFEKVDDEITYWRSNGNDAHYIDGLEDYRDLAVIEYEKLEDIHKRCDVMISHINPSSAYEHACDIFKDDRTSMFYSFDSNKLLKGTTAKYWFYGHTHGRMQYVKHGVACTMNTMGYKFEEPGKLTITLELDYETADYSKT